MMQVLGKPAGPGAPWRMRWLAVLYGFTLTGVTVAIWSEYLDSSQAERGANIGGALMWFAVILPTAPLWAGLRLALAGVLSDAGRVAFSCGYAMVQGLLAYLWASCMDRKLAAVADGFGGRRPGDTPPWLTSQLLLFTVPIAVGCPLLLWWLAASMPMMWPFWAPRFW